MTNNVNAPLRPVQRVVCSHCNEEMTAPTDETYRCPLCDDGVLMAKGTTT